MIKESLKINNIYHGFKVINIKHIADIDSLCFEMVHEKTGAKLLFLENEDENKVFSITFRTPPNDDTGVAHIVEHSVLCGSRKFPSKEPFVELVKGSLNTFLNAMTFPDKTMYPIASMNDKDFRNLMDVYLDAVFYPNMLNNPFTLMQEGWHFETENIDAPLTYSGVVYNEMKGALASPEAILERKSLNLLYPNTTYQFESGGDPEAIPNLTQEMFLDFHKKYYHPSNSYIYLYGKMDILDQLQFINDNYLNDFEKLAIDSSIKKEKPFAKRQYYVQKYPVTKGEALENKTYLSLNFSIADSLDRFTILAFGILVNAILDSQGAPLRRKLIEKNISEDVTASYENGIYQPFLSINLISSEEKHKAEFEKTVYESCMEIIKNGIDKDLLKASINQIEFYLREGETGSTPKGLLLNISLFNSWLYDGNPFNYLEFEDVIDQLKEKVETDYFEKLLEKYILNNTHSHLLVLKPDSNIQDENNEKLKIKLKNIKETLNNSDLEKIIETTKKLKELQAAPDSQENLNKIPLLSIKDIKKEATELKITTEKIVDVNHFFYTDNTKGICYLDLFFSGKNIKPEDYLYLILLAEMLKKVSTKNYTYSELDNKIRINTGGISFSTSVLKDKRLEDNLRFALCISGKALYPQMPILINLIDEILFNSNFDDNNRLKEILSELKVEIESDILKSSHNIAKSNLLSYINKNYYVKNLEGLPLYEFVKDILNNFSDKIDTVKEKLQLTLKNLLTKDNLDIVTTSENEVKNDLVKEITPFTKKLAEKNEHIYTLDFIDDVKNEGLISSSTVQYVFKGGDFKKLGFKYSGSMMVLETILRYDYLWTNIRVLGGAYGSFVNFTKDGLLFLGSYRDPHLKNTVNVFNDAGNYIKNLKLDSREINKYIIGTISKMDTPISKHGKGILAYAYYLNDFTINDIQKIRDEVLNISNEDINKLGDVLEAVMNENIICVVGSENAIKENENLFNVVKNIM